MACGGIADEPCWDRTSDPLLESCNIFRRYVRVLSGKISHDLLAVDSPVDNGGEADRVTIATEPVDVEGQT